MPVSTIGSDALASSSVTRPKIGYAGAVLQVVQTNFATQVSFSTQDVETYIFQGAITPTSSTFP